MATPSHDLSSSSAQSSGATLTYSHTIAANANYLKVGVVLNNASPDETVSVTWGGVALTKVTSIPKETNQFLNVSYWEKTNPASGTADIVITPSNGTDSVASTASSYFDVGSTRAAQTSNGTSTSPSLTVTSATGELVVDVVGTHDTSITACAQTQRGNVNDGPPNVAEGASEKAGETSTVMGWTTGAANSWGLIGVALQGSTGQSQAPRSMHQFRQRS